MIQILPKYVALTIHLLTILKGPNLKRILFSLFFLATEREISSTIPDLSSL
jgi:hypothetical protein